MKFTPNECPECGKRATYIVEVVHARAQLCWDDGEASYGYVGGSDMDWDSQEPESDGAGRVELGDGEHEWDAGVSKESA